MSWVEELPDKCPPEEAIRTNGVFYRLCANKPATDNDFLSQRAMCPDCNFNGVSECIARSLSLWKVKEYCVSLLKLPRHKNKFLMEISLTEDDGLHMRTFKKEGHYSWWRTKNFMTQSVNFISEKEA